MSDRAGHDSAKGVVRAYVGAITKRSWDTVDRLHGPGWRQTNPDGSEVGPDDYREQVEEFLDAFPDLAPTILDQVAEDGLVVTRLVWRGTHAGEFQGRPPTGRTVEIEVVRFDRIRDGSIAATRMVFDGSAVLGQLDG